jgi:septal ring factor EnvC (AmiA/AmiB activator)
MKLKGLSAKELRILETRLKQEIAQAEKAIAAQQSRLKKLKNEIGQVRARRNQLEYKERIRYEFVNLQIQ